MNSEDLEKSALEEPVADAAKATKRILAFSVDDDDRDVKIVINNPIILVYNSFVQTAERNIDRRQTANRFYLSATGAVLFASTIVLGDDLGLTPASKEVLILLLLLAGVLVQIFWVAAVLTSRRLSASKYEVIAEIERNHLPVRPFSREWDIHQQKGRDKLRFTSVELFIPAALGLALTAVLVLVFVGVIELPFQT